MPPHGGLARFEREPRTLVRATAHHQQSDPTWELEQAGRRGGVPGVAEVDGATDTEVSGADVTIDAPQDEQKFTPSGLRWPHW